VIRYATDDDRFVTLEFINELLVYTRVLPIMTTVISRRSDTRFDGNIVTTTT
jgi:hypothetical protein